MTIYNPLEQRFAGLPTTATPDQGLSLLVGLSIGLITHLVEAIREVAPRAPKAFRSPAQAQSTIDGRQCDHFNIVETTATRSARWEIWLEHSLY
jgi:hypothetical protein